MLTYEDARAGRANLRLCREGTQICENIFDRIKMRLNLSVKIGEYFGS